ncbi:uncharacterized protein LOC114316349 [Camellia sinensis]|uniref:uncharacterized protein LOC114316349 n=1 Tax=Camellia sinensis TaxID=4442 RepID=UPI0010358768|nr:uncharacterized protein LOC114316349 [Camellia sinensis]
MAVEVVSVPPINMSCNWQRHTKLHRVIKVEMESLLDVTSLTVVDGWKKVKKKGAIIKLDFEKAFESCVTSARISVLVNGSPTDEFCPQRGLRQGDPLSPFLFNLVAEGLNVLLSRAYQLGIIKGVKIGVGVWCCLICNLRMIPYFCAKLKIRRFAAILNCKTSKLPLQYLGLPLGANPSRKATWKSVVDKVRSRLASWKRKLLSHAGRLTLIKSARASLLVYYLSLFKMPDGVARVLERL